MKKISKDNLIEEESYLVFVKYSWSMSGFDICIYEDGELLSQTNNENVLSFCKAIYELPDETI